MANVEFSDEIRDRILYHWSELGDRPKIIWSRLQEEGFTVDLNTVQALMQCEHSDEEEAAETLAEQGEEDSRDDGASVPAYPDGDSTPSGGSPMSIRSNVRRRRGREGKLNAPQQNRRTKLTPDVLRLIEKILDTDGNIYSLAALQAALLAKGVKISKTTTFRALEKLGRSIVVKKMSFSSRGAGEARSEQSIAMKLVSQAEMKNRQRQLTILRDIGLRQAAGQQQAHSNKLDHGLVASTSTSAPSTTTTPPMSVSASGDDKQPAFSKAASGTVRPSGEAESSSSPSTVPASAPAASGLVLPPKKAVTASSTSLNLVLGHGGVTTYTSAPLQDPHPPDVDQGKAQGHVTSADNMELGGSSRSSPVVKKEVVDDDYEVKIDDDYELGIDEQCDTREKGLSLGERREGESGSRCSPEEDRRGREGVSSVMKSWMERGHDNDVEAAIQEARAISQRRLSHSRDEIMLGSDDDYDSGSEVAAPRPKRPDSLGRVSVGSVHSTHSAGSRASHSPHGMHQHQDSAAKSGRSSSTFTSHSGSSGGSGGMERNRRSPMAPSAAALSAAGLRHQSFPLTFHRSHLSNAAAMASRLGLTPDMGPPFHVGQRRIPLSAGRGGVKPAFMSKFQRDMNVRQAMASGMPRRMQRMAAAAASVGLPPGIPPHRLQKMMRMHQAMGKAMRGMHHFGGGGGRFHGHLRNRHMAEAQAAAAEAAAAAAAHGPANYSGEEDGSPELEIDPPETYGEFAERIFSAGRSQRQADPSPDTSGLRKWMGDISQRLDGIEGQLQLILDHLPFMAGADMHSVSSDPTGGGSEVDSGLQEDSVAGAAPTGNGDDRGGAGGGGEGGGAAAPEGADGGSSGEKGERMEGSDGGRGEGGSSSVGEGGGGGGDERGDKRAGGGAGVPGPSTRDSRPAVPRERGSDKQGRSRPSCFSECGDTRRADGRSTFRRAPSARGRAAGGAGGDGAEALDDPDCMVIDDKAEEDRFDDHLSDYGDMRNENQCHTNARIQMVIQDPRWAEMTPYAGAPRLAIALARYCIFGTRVLIRSSVTGRNSKHPLDFAGMRKIKHLLYQKYGSRCNPIEFEVIWKTSRESISQLCKRLRRKYNATGMLQNAPEDFMVDCPLLS